MIHTDKDICDGDRVQDKTEGFGCYIHTNRAKYIGNGRKISNGELTWKYVPMAGV